MIKISVDKQSQLSVLESLNAMTLPRKRRKRILQNASKGSVQTSRKNQKDQKDPSGKKWPKRAGKSRKKMQVRLASLLTVTGNDGSQATIGWRKGATEKVAAKQHYGHRERHTRASAIKALRNAKT